MIPSCTTFHSLIHPYTATIYLKRLNILFFHIQLNSWCFHMKQLNSWSFHRGCWWALRQARFSSATARRTRQQKHSCCRCSLVAPPASTTACPAAGTSGLFSLLRWRTPCISTIWSFHCWIILQLTVLPMLWFLRLFCHLIHACLDLSFFQRPHFVDHLVVILVPSLRRLFDFPMPLCCRPSTIFKPFDAPKFLNAPKFVNVVVFAAPPGFNQRVHPQSRIWRRWILRLACDRSTCVQAHVWRPDPDAGFGQRQQKLCNVRVLVCNRTAAFSAIYPINVLLVQHPGPVCRHNNHLNIVSVKMQCFNTCFFQSTQYGNTCTMKPGGWWIITRSKFWRAYTAITKLVRELASGSVRWAVFHYAMCTFSKGCYPNDASTMKMLTI